jgi:hypothetical protein
MYSIKWVHPPIGTCLVVRAKLRKPIVHVVNVVKVRIDIVDIVVYLSKQ